MSLIDEDKIDAAYSQLPESLKKVLDSEETAITIGNLGKKYSLHIDQLGQLTKTVHATLLGIISRNDFSHQLKQNTGLSDDQINLITYDLNQEIFSKIRGELEKMTLPGQNTSPQQMFDQKMGGITNVPKQEVEVKTQTGDNENKDAVAKPVRDPYREPLV